MTCNTCGGETRGGRKECNKCLYVRYRNKNLKAGLNTKGRPRGAGWKSALKGLTPLGSEGVIYGKRAPEFDEEFGEDLPQRLTKEELKRLL